MIQMNIMLNPNRGLWPELCQRPVMDNAALTPLVADIMNQVKLFGDKALLELNETIDGVKRCALRVSDEEWEIAADGLNSSLKAAMQTAFGNILAFHRAQVPANIEVQTMPGIRCSRQWLPLQRVGLYIPGGSAPLCSTVLMLAIPALVAGCSEVVLCTPPNQSGNINPAILYAARLCGVTAVYKCGGAQAIAAMTYGTDSIPRVDKIFGPGNQYVTKAKQLAALEGMAIDMPAGPSEVMVVVDKTSNASFAAADLLSQAEHGADSQVVLLSNNVEKINEVLTEVGEQLQRLPRKAIALAALTNCRCIVFDEEEILVDFMNAYAPEHLILAIENPELRSAQVRNAGSVFLGPYTPEAAGDYATGTNHTLPTNGAARAWSGLGVESFMKSITFQSLTQQGLESIGNAVMELAKAEQLQAHSNAIAIRLATFQKNNDAKI